MKTAIVLTGSIVPAVNFVVVADVSERRAQYLAALRFYSDFAQVYFLENSTYDIAADPEFLALQNVRIRRFSMSNGADRGKGYHEFAMLDTWHDSETSPPERFLKITGRYLLRNIAAFLAECRRAGQRTLLIDRFANSEIALTSVFSVSWGGYGELLKGLYRQMNDSDGLWAERVYYAALRNSGTAHIFAHEPELIGVSGSTGQALKVPRLKWAAKQVLRSLNRVVDPKLLYFRK